MSAACFAMISSARASSDSFQARTHNSSPPFSIWSLQIGGVMMADPARKHRADQPAGASGEHGGGDGRAKCATRHHDRADRDGCADISEAADQRALGVADCRGRNECRARHGRIVRQLVGRSIIAAELCRDRVLARKKAELSAIETGAKQFVDCGFEILGLVEHSDHFADAFELRLSGHDVLLLPACAADDRSPRRRRLHPFPQSR